MSSDELKKAIGAGWDDMSDSYQAESLISLDDVHYGPLCPGERELKLIGDVEGKRVLELACGAAQNSISLAKWGAKVTALDISAKQLSAAKFLLEQENTPVHLIRGDMESLRMFRDESFDIVISSFGWEFVPNLESCLDECQRVMAKGALLIVCTVHPLSAFEWDDEEKTLYVDNYFSPPVEVWGAPEENRKQPAITYFHTIEEMFASLTSAGFTVENIIEPCPHPVPYMTDEEKRAIPYGGPFWEGQYERFSRVPFSIVYRARRL